MTLPPYFITPVTIPGAITGTAQWVYWLGYGPRARWIAVRHLAGNEENPAFYSMDSEGCFPGCKTLGAVQWVWVSFSGVNRPRRGADHPPPSSAGVKENTEPYLCSIMACYKEKFTFWYLHSPIYALMTCAGTLSLHRAGTGNRMSAGN
jgi:hypothetical protein